MERFRADRDVAAPRRGDGVSAFGWRESSAERLTTTSCTGSVAPKEKAAGAANPCAAPAPAVHHAFAVLGQRCQDQIVDQVLGLLIDPTDLAEVEQADPAALDDREVARVP